MSIPFLHTCNGLDDEELDVAGSYIRGIKDRPTREDPGSGTPPEIEIEEIIDNRTGQDAAWTSELEDHLYDQLVEKICAEDSQA